VRGCERVYLEAYTSILMVEKEKLVSRGWEISLSTRRS
jgi:diphthamide biosynthesis methyltransferase